MRTAAVKSFAAGLIVGTLTVATAAAAKADPDNVSVAYADMYGTAVCETLDDYPNFNGIIGIGQALFEDGLTGQQAGWVVAMSVFKFCPRHTDLIQRFARSYQGEQIA